MNSIIIRREMTMDEIAYQEYDSKFMDGIDDLLEANKHLAKFKFIPVDSTVFVPEIKIKKIKEIDPWR